MATIRREWDVFWVAVTFLTRLPAPACARFEPDYLHQASRYFPLVGLLIGTLVAGVYSLLALVLPSVLAVLLCTGFSLYLTGAFHEDGFADLCDGFGGGFDVERKLDIMKDSRVGTYGLVGLGVLLATKITALASLPAIWIAPALVVGHVVSRSFSISYLAALPYVRQDQNSKVKPLATSIAPASLVLALLTPLPLLVWLAPDGIVGPLLLMLAVLWWWFRRLLLRNLGGFTGDCLGAAQQLAEVAYYLVLVALLSA